MTGQQNTVNNESEATLAFTESDKIHAKIDGNRMFVGTSILKGFWEGFGMVLGGFWDTEILDFRICFVIFSVQNLQ